MQRDIFTMKKKDESSAESKDETKQEALWTKTLQWTGIGVEDTVIAV